MNILCSVRQKEKRATDSPTAHLLLGENYFHRPSKNAVVTKTKLALLMVQDATLFKRSILRYCPYYLGVFRDDFMINSLKVLYQVKIVR